MPDAAERAAEAGVGHAMVWTRFRDHAVETLLKRAKTAKLSGWGFAEQALPALG